MRNGLSPLAGLLLALFSACRPATQNGPFDLAGSPVEPLSVDAKAKVFVFVRSDCPIANRHAPELRRLHQAYAVEGVRFWLVYPDPRADSGAVRAHLEEFTLPFEALRDPHQVLARELGVTISPEAAVVDEKRRLVYRGRIDDRAPASGILRPPSARDLDAAIHSVLNGTATGLTTTRAVGCYLSDLSDP